MFPQQDSTGAAFRCVENEAFKPRRSQELSKKRGRSPIFSGSKVFRAWSSISQALSLNTLTFVDQLFFTPNLLRVLQRYNKSH